MIYKPQNVLLAEYLCDGKCAGVGVRAPARDSPSDPVLWAHLVEDDRLYLDRKADSEELIEQHRFPKLPVHHRHGWHGLR